MVNVCDEVSRTALHTVFEEQTNRIKGWKPMKIHCFPEPVTNLNTGMGGGSPIGEKRQPQRSFSPNGEVVALSRIDWYVSFVRPVPFGKKRAVKVHVLCLQSYHFDVIRKEQHQWFKGTIVVVHEKEKQEWAYYGALWNTIVHWNCSREFFTGPERYSSVHRTTTAQRPKDFIFTKRNHRPLLT